MPQLNPAWFASQLFWLVVCMALLYTVLARFILPPLMGIIEQRRAKREWDLSSADQLNMAAEHKRKEYDRTLIEARSKAQGVLTEAERVIKETTEKALSDLGRTLASQSHEAEQRVNAQKQNLLSKLEPAAAELAAQVVTQFAGINADVARAQRIVHDYTKQES